MKKSKKGKNYHVQVITASGACVSTAYPLETLYAAHRWLKHINRETYPLSYVITNNNAWLNGKVSEIEKGIFA